MTGIIIAAVVVPVLVIGVLSAVIIITIIIICCYKNKCKCSLLRTLCEKEVQQNGVCGWVGGCECVYVYGCDFKF